MTCASCVSHVEKSLQRIKGVYNVLVGLMIERAEIRYDPKEADEKAFIDCILSLGYRAQIIEESNSGIETLNLNVKKFYN